MQKFIDNQRTFPDYLVKITAPNMDWEDPDLKNGKIRTIDQISTSFHKGAY